MFRLQLTDFKCWTDCAIEIPLGQLTLIKGNSGSGKTTLFQAIEWLLYGKLRNIEPFNEPDPKTKVTASFPHCINGSSTVLTIERRRNPRRLRLSYHNKTFEDAVAQSMMDNLFGTYDLWLASCYIEQGCRNSFLTSPNNGKMELLNSIAFHDQDPSFFIDKIQANIVETTSSYTKQSTLFTHQLQSSTEILKTDTSKALSPQQLSSVMQTLDTLTTEKTKLDRIRSERDISLGIIQDCKQQLYHISRERSTIIIPEPSPDLSRLNALYQNTVTIDTIDDIIQKMRSLIPILQRRDDLASETQHYANQLKVKTLPNDNLTFTTEDYHNAILQETSYKTNKNLADQCGIPYDKASIDHGLSYYKTLLDAQQRLTLEHQSSTITTQLSHLESQYEANKTPLSFTTVPPEYSQYDTTDLEIQKSEILQEQGAITSHIAHLEASKDIIECPRCQGALRYSKGVLTLANDSPSTASEIENEKLKLSQLKTKLLDIDRSITKRNSDFNLAKTSYEYSKNQHQQAEHKREMQQDQRNHQINQLKSELHTINEKLETLTSYTIPVKLLTKTEIEQTNLVLGKLSNITIIPPPETPSIVIKDYLTYQEIKQKYVSAKQSYEAFEIPSTFRDVTLASLHLYIKGLQDYASNLKRSIEEQSRTTKIKDMLEQKIKSCEATLPDDPLPRIIQIDREIIEANQSITDSKQAHTALEVHATLTRQREQVVQLYTKLADLEQLKEHAINTECRILQQVVDSVNNQINTVCNILFDRDISVELSLYKTAKTTGHTKPSVNFSISYQGGTFDAVKLMSGGESDRASLALTIALNRMSSWPLLILDESLASLDINMKDYALRAIRENTTHGVCIIMHEGIEGLFDHVINIDELH